MEMEMTTCNHPTFGIIRGLTMKQTMKRDELPIRIMLAGIKTVLIDDLIPKEIQVKCGWCGKDMGTKTGNFTSVDDVSHGICEACAESFLEDAKEYKA